MERTHTQERYGHRRSQIKKFVEKTEEHSFGRFAELPDKASDCIDHAEGGPYTVEEDRRVVVRISYC